MLKVALCDFNHTTVGIHTETMPLAIGLLAAYAQHQHPDQLDIRLFKFTEDFLDEIETWKPDIMGLSLYSWNTQLNLHIAQLVHNKFPHVIIVAGGPNIPINKDDVLKFFIRYPFVNLLIIKDGEIPFSRILGKLLEGYSREELVQGKLAGTIAVEPGSLKLVQGELGLKIRDLDQVPSPYLNGLMDKFFAYKKHTLAPFIETNRGCPFACTFCHTSAKYYNKIQWA